LKEKKNNTTADKWTKAQIITASRYVHERDVVTAVLEDGQEYTIDDVDQLVRNFMEGGAN
jgi:hypothetical protein